MLNLNGKLLVGPVSVPAEAAAHFASNYYQMYDIMSSTVHGKQLALYLFNITGKHLSILHLIQRKCLLRDLCGDYIIIL